MQPDAEALRWGTMKTTDGRAIERLASIVLHCQRRDRLSLRDAASQVLDRLAEFPAIDLFETAPAGGPAELVGEGRVWQHASNGRAAGQAQHRGGGNFATMGGELMADKPTTLEARSKARPACAELRGVSGLRAWLRLGWADRAIVPAQLESHGGRIAIPAAVAWALFGYANTVAVAKAAVPAVDAPDSGNVAPEAARWFLPKHVAGARWTDAEKAEMRRLRDVERLSDAEIAALVGTKRQTIGQVIGSRKPRKGGAVVGITRHLAR